MLTEKLQWKKGPPPSDLDGQVVLVTLDQEEVAKRAAVNPRDWEYYGEPVAVAWWGHKGKTTLSAHRINPEMIKYHAIPEMTS